MIDRQYQISIWATILGLSLLSSGVANAAPPPARVEVINVPGVFVENLPQTQAVVDRNAPAANPFQVNVSDFRQNTNFTLSQFEPIPDGYRAVIEDVSALAIRTDDDPAGSELSTCEISVRSEFNAALFTRFLPSGDAAQQIGQNSTTTIETVSARVTVYIEPGQKPWVECIWLRGGDFVRLDASISGYLLPLD